LAFKFKLPLDTVYSEKEFVRDLIERYDEFIGEGFGMKLKQEEIFIAP
jgi:hypothetical protein